MMTTSLPIACTLPLGAYAGRVGAIAALNQAFLRSYRPVGLALELVYEPSAALQVRDLVDLERQCCAFLRFELHEAGDEIRLTIYAPLEARDAVDAVFAPFLAGATAEGGPGSGVVVESPGVPFKGASGDCEANAASTTVAEAAQEVKAGGRRVGAAAITTAGAAVACSVCCVLPFAFPAVALTAFGSLLAAVAGVYWWALSVSVAVVVAGWLWVGWQSRRTGRRAASSTLRAMALATLFLGAALSWPFVESQIIAMLRS